jgi:hypothetical protein
MYEPRNFDLPSSNSYFGLHRKVFALYRFTSCSKDEVVVWVPRDPRSHAAGAR